MIDEANADIASAEAGARLRHAGPCALPRPGEHRRRQRPARAAGRRRSAQQNAQLQQQPCRPRRGAAAGRGAADRSGRKAETQVQHAQAVEQQAALNLGYTHHRRADRRHGRRALAARRPVCAGRHPADGGRAAAGRLRRRQLQGDAADQRARRPAGRRSRSIPSPAPRCTARSTASRRRAAWSSPAAARQRDRQLHQDRAAHPGEDRAGRDEPLAGLLRAGMSVEPDDRHRDRAGRERPSAAGLSQHRSPRATATRALNRSRRSLEDFPCRPSDALHIGRQPAAPQLTTRRPTRRRWPANRQRRGDADAEVSPRPGSRSSAPLSAPSSRC